MKAKITSGIRYFARNANGAVVEFGIVNGEIVIGNDVNARLHPSKDEVKTWNNIYCSGESIVAIDDKVYFETMYAHDGEYYSEDNAIEAIRNDDDRFREWCDENSEYVTIMGVDFGVDYDTLDSWGILEEVKDSFDDDVPTMLVNGDYADWEIVESEADDENRDYYLMDNGELIEACDVNRDYVAQLIDIVMSMHPEVNTFGDWMVTKADKSTATVANDAPKITLNGVMVPTE